MIVFKFREEKIFKDAVNSLKSAIKNIGTSKFDFNYQPEDKTIQVSEEHADIVESYLKKSGIKDFSLDRGYGKYSGNQTFIPPKNVAEAAAKGLKYREKAGGKGGLTPEQASKEGIGSGVQRAVNLKNRDKLSLSTIKKMKAFFDRHQKNKSINPKHKNDPWKDRGYVAWLLWGGDPGYTWAKKILKQIEKNKKMAQKIVRAYLS